MDTLVENRSYRNVVDHQLRAGEGVRRRGVNALAKAMKCHATFLAKVLAGRADFSMEQALAFCEYCAFSEFQTQYFVALVQEARASDQRTKRFFAARLEGLRQLELSQRLEGPHKPSPEIQSEYYTSWLPQYVHIACQTEQRCTVASLAAQVQVPETKIAEVIRMLMRGGVLREDQGVLRSAVDFMHLPRESHLVPSMHQQWRLKVCDDIGRQMTTKGVHFSGLMSVDKTRAEKIRAGLMTHLAEVRSIVATAPSKEVFYLGVDFYEPG